MRRSVIRFVVGMVASAILGLGGCNYTDGPCYRREDIVGQGGGGGGLITPGQGGFGDVPPRPQGAGEPQPVDCDDGTADDGASCGSAGTLTSAETLTYCNGACESKCPKDGVHGFSPSAFKFVTTVEDDGTGEAGGYQAAVATLSFFRWTTWIPEYWTCPLVVQMPIRTQLYGTISASKAATMTAEIASDVSMTLMKVQPALPSGIFCSKLKLDMRAQFKIKYPMLGATVTQ